ncbi:MAG: IclR family transcriptional regulator [Clostridia bacterium]|nr:IclR family transcriptional regulator [Clostridia bacterium]
MEKEGMQSVARIFSVIEKVAESQTGLGISELARAVSLPKSTVHRTVGALVDNNYLIKDDNDRYKLGYRFIAIAKRYTNKLDLREMAGPYVQQLVRALNVTGHIAVRQGDYAVYIEKIQPHSYVCMYSEIGKSIELYCSSLGKSLMLGFSESELKEYLTKATFNRYTATTLTKCGLVKELQLVRDSGIAFDNAEHEENVYCMSVPIYDYTDKVIGAISVTSREKDFFNNIEAIELLKKCGKDISRLFGR